MPDPVRVQKDDRLTSRVVRATELTYDDDPDPDAAHERPPHVRAASSLAHLVDQFVLIQDDANFLALVDPQSHRVRSVALPPHPEHGTRVHDYDEGTGHHKLDLEACTAVPGTDERLLVAFGSGSNPSREWIVLVDWRADGDGPDATLYEAPAFYERLRATHAFSGSGLNIEGAVFAADDTLRLFQRGNAAPKGGLQPIDATADVSWAALYAHLQEPDVHAPPAVGNIVPYELGTLDGVRLTFSDAEQIGDAVLFSASAEDPDTGDVTGSVLGVIDAEGARWAELIDRDGTDFEGKVEGLSFVDGTDRRVHFVIDADDAASASRIFEAELDGPWFDSVSV